MKFEFFGSKGLAALAVLSLAAGPAAARGVFVDNGNWSGMGPGEQDLGFQIDAGHGLTSKIYIYANGLVSIGAPLTLPVDPLLSLGDVTGADYFTSLYSPNYGDLGGPARANLGYPSFSGVYQDNVDYNYSQFIIAPAPGNPGAFFLSFRQGDASQPAPNYPTDTLIGYNIGGEINELGYYATNDQDFYFNLGSAVPEPGVWALMIVGFGLAGTVLRRRNTAAV